MAFEILGKPVSGNRASRWGPERPYKNSDKTEFEERVRSLAIEATVKFRWKIPEYVAVQVVAINTLMDVDNLTKGIFDGMERIVYHRDGRIRDLHVRKIDEKGRPERYLITVRPMERE